MSSETASHHTPDHATLVVERQHQSWLDSARQYRVLVDGKEVARVRNGSSCRVALTPGRHSVVVRVDWTGSRSVSVDADAGQEVRLVVRWRGNLLSRHGYLTLGPDATLVPLGK